MEIPGQWTVWALASSLLLTTSVARARGWVEAAPLAEARQEVAVAELGGRVYVIGGITAIGAIADTVEVYDPGGDRWSFVAPLPTPAHHAAAAAVGDRLYVVGGWSDFFQTPLDSLYAYDPSLDAWLPRAPMPTARGSPAAAVWDGRLYVMGGSPPAREQDFAVYDPDTDVWTPLPIMPTPRNHLAAGVIEGILYAVGGRIASLTPTTNTGTLEAFEIATGEWSSRTSMPTPRSGIAAAVPDGWLLVFGGEQSPGQVFGEAEAYDPGSDRWTTLAPMPTPRHGIGAAVLPGGVHIPGGGPREGFGVTDVHEIFVPEPGATLGALAALAGVFLVARPGRVRRPSNA